MKRKNRLRPSYLYLFKQYMEILETRNESYLNSICEYRAVVYLRCLKNTQINILFTLSRSRLTTIKGKTLTIPKLELHATTLATRLKVSVLDQ